MRGRPRAAPFDKRVQIGGASGGPNLLLQTQNLISAMTTPPTQARIALIDAVISSLLNAGYWGKLDFFYMLAAADEQAARLNWISPGILTLTAVNSPAFTVDQGFTGDGATSYLTATVSGVLANYLAASAHIAHVAVTSTASAIDGLWIGNSSASSRGGVKARNGATASFIRVAGSAVLATAASAINDPKMVAGDRVDTSNASIYENGALNTTGVNAGVATGATANVRFCATSAAFTDQLLAFGCAGGSLGAAGHTLLYNSVKTYLAGVGITI